MQQNCARTAGSCFDDIDIFFVAAHVASMAANGWPGPLAREGRGQNFEGAQHPLQEQPCCSETLLGSNFTACCRCAFVKEASVKGLGVLNMEWACLAQAAAIIIPTPNRIDGCPLMALWVKPQFRASGRVELRGYSVGLPGQQSAVYSKHLFRAPKDFQDLNRHELLHWYMHVNSLLPRDESVDDLLTSFHRPISLGNASLALIIMANGRTGSIMAIAQLYM